MSGQNVDGVRKKLADLSDEELWDFASSMRPNLYETVRGHKDYSNMNVPFKSLVCDIIMETEITPIHLACYGIKIAAD